MRRLLGQRPSASTIIALIALFVALGGTSYAVINGSKLKKHSVAGKKLKNDTLSGQQIKESKLGQVPEAAQATNASKLDGIDSTGLMQVNALRARESADTSEDFDYGDDATLLQLLNLAGGQYVITAKLQVDNDDVADQLIDCDLVTTSNAVETQRDTMQQEVGAAASQSSSRLGYTLIGEFTASEAGTDDV